jgi:hypothetical protein
MDSNKENPASSCGPDCSCNTKRGMALPVKIVLLIAIVAVAGAVLSNSLNRKAAQKAPAESGAAYAVKASSSQVKTDSSHSSAADSLPVVFQPLASISALNEAAQDVDGVFILLVGSDTEKTPGIAREVTAAKKAIFARGTRMGTFQLAGGSPDFAPLAGQLKLPGVVVIMKGRGMRGVSGADINETKLLQACLAAMQPTSCCPAGGKRVCK